MLPQKFLLCSILFWIAFGLFAYGVYYYWINEYPIYASIGSGCLAVFSVYSYYKYGYKKYQEERSDV